MYVASTEEPIGGMGIGTESNVEFGSGLHGVLHEGGQRGAVVLSHGAGRGLDTPLLATTAVHLASAGFNVLRWNFGYLGVRGGPSAGSKREIADMLQAIEFMNGRGPLILAGKSFGARVSTYVAAGRDDVKAMFFYGLPLHGLGKNAKPRDWSHLGDIRGRMLFITGNRDQLCPLDHLAEVQKYIQVPFKSEVVPGDHSFKPHGEDRAIELAVSWLEECF